MRRRVAFQERPLRAAPAGEHLQLPPLFLGERPRLLLTSGGGASSPAPAAWAADFWAAAEAKVDYLALTTAALTRAAVHS